MWNRRQETDMKNQLNKMDPKAFFSKFGIVLVMIVLTVIFTSMEPGFISTANIINIIRQASIMIIVACGATFVMVAGGIDVSVGGVACLTGIIVAKLLSIGMPVALALLLGAGVGGVLGLCSGMMVSHFHIAPMIATLAIMNLANGAANLTTGGTAVYNLPESFIMLGRGYIAGIIPLQVIIMLGIAAVSYIVLSKTAFGRRVYAIGGNEMVAELSGINVRKNKIIYYILSGICASIAGMIMTSRMGSGQPSMGATWNMDSITAIVIGGTSLNGGSGSITGSVLGTIMMVMITNGLNIVGVNSFWQMVISAMILIITIIVYRND
ncbi:putative ribose transport system permease protein RbsC [Clostridiales bacterium 1_7_47FAA]|nr:putative ribose transport system permease protein RbsC [Clostridiales bacterium 1_7_47FAA]